MTVAIRRADPEARRLAAWIAVSGAVAGISLLLLALGYQEALRDWLLSDPARTPARLRYVVAVLAALVAGPAFACSAVVWWVARLTERAGEFPPPGVPVVRDTPVLTGDAARSRARVLKALALAIALVTAGALLVLARFAALPGQAG